MKHVIVTGGSRGIGLGIVDSLLRKGYRVSTCSRSQSDDLSNLQHRHPDMLRWFQCRIGEDDPEQFIGQAVGLVILRRRWGREHLPFRMWLYPLPVVMAIVGWAAIFISTGRIPMLASLAATAAGILVYLGRARLLDQWPFGKSVGQAAKG